MTSVFLLLGANLGDPKIQIKSALDLIENNIGIIVNQSSLYTSEAWGVENQPIFFNQVIEITTGFSPIQVLNASQHIENTLGRVRDMKWGSRVIDIDILYYNDIIIEEDILQVPHPYIQERNFTLVPLVEIAPDFIHPILHKSNKELLHLTTDKLKVQITHD